MCHTVLFQRMADRLFRCLFRTALLVSFTQLCVFSFADENISVFVGSQPRQQFHGFGANAVFSRFFSISGRYVYLTQESRDEMASAAWGPEGADLRYLRIWLDYTELQKIPTMAARYRPMIDDIKKVQPDLVIVFTSYTKYIATKYEAPIPVDWYTAGFARAVRELRENDIPIEVVEVANEPNDHNICTDSLRMAYLIKRFREELDSQGLENGYRERKRTLDRTGDNGKRLGDAYGIAPGTGDTSRLSAGEFCCAEWGSYGGAFFK